MTHHDFIAALPLIILAGTGLLVMLWDAFEKTPSRAPLYLCTLGGLSAAGVAAMHLGTEGLAFDGLFFFNSFSSIFTIIFCAAAVLSALLAERYLHSSEVLIGEFSALTLFAGSGMIMMASGANLIVTFLGLETMSICFYIMAGMFRTKKESNEAALKYFLLGSFATGFFLYGIALLYGSFGTISIERIHHIVSNSASLDSPLVILGAVLIIIGLCFKVAAFPFHQWAPDVYEGAPTIVAGYMSTAGKAAAFSVFALLFGYGFGFGTFSESAGGYGKNILTIISAIAVCSMLYGNIVAVSQKKIKRMLAYSSTAHAGYILLGVAAMNVQGVTGLTIYSAVYTLMQIGAFGIVALIEKDSGKGLDLDDYAGLAKREPVKALLLSVLMLSLAGIPPFAGFFGKYYLFLAALKAGLLIPVIAGVVSSAIAAYFYLRVIVLMYFREAKEIDAPKERIDVSLIAVGLAAGGLLVLGLLPDVMVSAAQNFLK